MEAALSLSPSLLSLLLTCQDDRRGVGRLWGELLGGGRVVAGRGRGGRLIRNLGARAEVARVPAPQFTADVHRVVLQVRISIYRTIFRSPPLLSFARALRKMQRERERGKEESLPARNSWCGSANRCTSRSCWSAQGCPSEEEKRKGGRR